MPVSDDRAKIARFLTTNFYVADAGSLADDASLLDQGIVDSTGVLEVITFLETEFAIKVEDAEMTPDNLDSISNLVAFVARKKARAQ
jgi:acyl carrier protein